MFIVISDFLKLSTIKHLKVEILNSAMQDATFDQVVDGRIMFFQGVCYTGVKDEFQEQNL